MTNGKVSGPDNMPTDLTPGFMQGKGFISRGYASMDHNGQTDPVPTEVTSRNGGLGLRCMCRINLSTVFWP